MFQNYQRQWRRVNTEFVLVCVIHTIENLLMVSPMMYLLSKATERHKFLEETVGAVGLEIDAMNTIHNFVKLLISVVVFLLPFQIATYWMYNLIGHPWKRFLYQIYIKNETIIEK